MVKRSSVLPKFDERFVNYGFNKITWLHHLIRRGYYFGVISRGFVMDLPHPECCFGGVLSVGRSCGSSTWMSGTRREARRCCACIGSS